MKPRIFLIAVGLALLIGCGQRGNLYLPEDAPKYPSRADQNTKHTDDKFTKESD